MGGIGFTIEIAPNEGARPIRELCAALFEIVNETIYDFTHARKAYKPVRMNSMSESLEDSTDKSLSFAFSDGGGQAYLSMEALHHWNRLLVAAMRESGDLDTLAARFGYRVTEKKTTLADARKDEAKRRVFVEIRSVLYEVARNDKGKPYLSADDSPEAIGMADLNATERALVEKVDRSRECACLVCAALAKGKRPRVPKPPKPPKPRRGSLAVGVASRKKVISIQHTKDRTFPPEVFAAKGLKDLSIWDAPIAMIPDQIGELTGLQRLQIGHTKVKRLPATASKLTALRSLTLSYHRLASIDEIEALTWLDTLALNGAGPIVSELDFTGFTRLRWLELNGCALTKVPKGLEKLTQLEWLDLRDNPLSPRVLDGLRRKLPKTDVLPSKD